MQWVRRIGLHERLKTAFAAPRKWILWLPPCAPTAWAAVRRRSTLDGCAGKCSTLAHRRGRDGLSQQIEAGEQCFRESTIHRAPNAPPCSYERQLASPVPPG